MLLLGTSPCQIQNLPLTVKVPCKIVADDILNPCHAESGYTLPFQTV